MTTGVADLLERLADLGAEVRPAGDRLIVRAGAKSGRGRADAAIATDEGRGLGGARSDARQYAEYRSW